MKEGMEAGVESKMQKKQRLAGTSYFRSIISVHLNFK